MNEKVINFTIVTSLIDNEQGMPKNVTIIKGDWNSTILTDQKIKELYQGVRKNLNKGVLTAGLSGTFGENQLHLNSALPKPPRSFREALTNCQTH